MPFQPGSHPGILHHYAPRLVAFEHQPAPPPSAATSFVLFLGGLSDSLMTVRYPSVLAAHAQLPPHWSVAEVQIAASGAGWTQSSPTADADDLARTVAYFRALAAARDPAAPCRVVLLGHSTGSQDVATYLIGPWKEPAIPEAALARPRVDAAVLQAGISDREGVVAAKGAAFAGESLRAAEAMVAAGRGEDAVPLAATDALFGANPTARRWASLLGPEGDDDLFSSDVPDARVDRVFGRGGIAGRRVPLLVLIGGEDEHMPEHVDRDALVARWERAVKAAGGMWDVGSGVVPGAGHNLNKSDESAVQDLCGRILGLVGRVDGAAAAEKL